MRTIKYFATLTLMAVTAVANAEPMIVSSKAGQLAERLPAEASAIEDLTITGTIDTRDIDYIRENLNGIIRLDLSGCDIVAAELYEPDWLNRRNFKADVLPAYSFTGFQAQEIILPRQLSEIGECAFAGAKVQSLTFPARLSLIGDWAFAGSAVKDVKLPATESIGKGLFRFCENLTKADLAALQIKELPAQTFAYTSSLTELILPPTLTRLGDEAFIGSGLDKVSPGNLEAGEYVYAEMPRLTTAIVSDAALSKGEFFHSTSLDSLEGSPRKIGDYALAQCTSFNGSNVASGAVNIGNSALADTNISQLVFGENLTSIGESAFRGMQHLASIDAKALGSNIPDVEAAAFNGLKRPDIKLYVADNTEDAWRSHPEWGQFNILSGVSVVVPAIVDKKALSVSIRDNLLTVVTESYIDRLDVFDENGHNLGGVSSTEGHISLTIPESSNVVIVKVCTPEWTDVRKIIRR